MTMLVSAPVSGLIQNAGPPESPEQVPPVPPPLPGLFVNLKFCSPIVSLTARPVTDEVAA